MLINPDGPLSKSGKAIIAMDNKSAERQLHEMHSVLELKTFRACMGWLNRVYRQVYEGVFVDHPGVKRVKELLAAGKKVVLLPAYKSYSDFFLLLYVLYINEIQIPYTIGHFEDNPEQTFWNKVLVRLGYIMARRSRD